MIYPLNQKPPIWSIDPGIVAYNCQKAGFLHPVLTIPMWEGAGKRALDYSGHGYYVDIAGTTTWEKNGLLFDANDENAITPTIVNHNIGTGDFTYCAWVDIPAILSGYSAICMNGDWSPGLYGSMTAGEFGFYWAGEKASGTSLPVGRSFVIGLRRNGELEYYLDGKQTANTYSVGTPMSNNIFVVGNNNTTKSESLGGTIIQEIFFGFAFTIAQIKFIYENPYFMYQIPEELYGYVVEPPIPFIPRIIMF